MQPSLVGVRLKIKRSNSHLLQLCAAVNSFYVSGHEADSLAVEPDPERKRLKFVVDGGIRATDPDWALMAGDVVHNLRSALDHLVCQLAILAGNSAASCRANRVAFPICIDHVTFEKTTRRIKKLLSAEAFASIEELQPYKAADSLGISRTETPLWIMSELDMIDKHRMLLVVGGHHKLTDIVFTSENGLTRTIPARGQWQSLEDGTEIASIDNSVFSSYEEGEMYVEMQGVIGVLFKDTGCCDGLPVHNVLNSCGSHVSAIVDEFETKFFGR